MKANRIDHVGMVVNDVDAALQTFKSNFGPARYLRLDEVGAWSAGAASSSTKGAEPLVFPHKAT